MYVSVGCSDDTELELLLNNLLPSKHHKSMAMLQSVFQPCSSLAFPSYTPQGPLRQTSAHFWQMVWEQNTYGVVMLNKIIEKGMVRMCSCV